MQLGAKSYVLVLSWNHIANSWNLDIADYNNNPLINGIALVAGLNLLEQYKYMNFGGVLFAESLAAPFIPPTYENLGKEGKLYFVTAP